MLARSPLALDEGSLGERRTTRKIRSLTRQVLVAHEKGDTKRVKALSAQIASTHEKGERGGRWGTKGTSPAARKAEREFATQEIERHPTMIRFFRRMRKHREAQVPGRQSDPLGIGYESRLPEEIKAKREALPTPKIHPSVQTAMTKARLQKERGERE